MTEMDLIQQRDRMLRKEQEENRKQITAEAAAGSGFSGHLSVKIIRANPTRMQRIKDFFKELIIGNF